jgi:hypothetical protein
MDRKLPMFVWGAMGALVYFVLLFGLNWDTLSRLSEVTGGPRGLVIAVAGCVAVAALSGALTILVQPANPLGAMLFGFVPPALLAVSSIPRAGVPELERGKPLKDSLGEKTKQFAVWTALNPVATLSDLRTDRVLAESIAAHERAIAQAREEATKQAADAARQLLESELGKARTERETEVAAARQQGAADAQAARAEAEAAAKAAMDALRTEASEARARRDEAVAQNQRFAADLAALQAKVAAADTGEASALRAELDEARAQLAASAEQVRVAATLAADLDRVAAWYQAQPASSTARLLRVCEGKLRDRDPAERATACRMLGRCGADAKKLLERALGDSDPAVAEAALAAIEKLGG